jgi:hypothetical protein
MASMSKKRATIFGYLNFLLAFDITLQKLGISDDPHGSLSSLIFSQSNISIVPAKSEKGGK